MLSNIVLIITLILLVIILILLYFFSNDIRKNKNKINILESDINSIREIFISNNQKITSLENIVNSDLKKKHHSLDNLNNQQNFSDILEKLGSMNNDFFPEGMINQNENFLFDNEEESDETTSEDEEEDDEEDDDEDEDDEDDDDDDDEDENLLEEIIKNESIAFNDPEEIIIENIKEEVKEVEHVEEKKVNLKEKVEEESKDSNSSNKLPKKSVTNLEIGTVELGGDNTTKYSVQLNKGGRKYWKKM